MANSSTTSVDFEAQQKKAHEKVVRQSDVVRGLNGTAALHPEESVLLNEMQQNKAAVDINRAIFEYNRDTNE